MAHVQASRRSDRPVLRVCRLYEREDFADRTLSWVRRYGFPIEFYYENEPLGPISLSSLLYRWARVESARNKERERPGHQEPASWRVSVTSWGQRGARPPSMSVEQLRQMSHLAWDTLAHYEALVGQEPRSALYLPNGDVNPTYKQMMEQHHRPKSDLEERCLYFIKERAQVYVEARVTKNINDYCLLKPLEEGYRGGLESKWAWDFRDLRGAMYLQLMWLMERGVKVGRCK